MTDYYTRGVEYNNTEGQLKSAHDLHEGDEPSFEGLGDFSTDLYTRQLTSLEKECVCDGAADQESSGGDPKPPS